MLDPKPGVRLQLFRGPAVHPPKALAGCSCVASDGLNVVESRTFCRAFGVNLGQRRDQAGEGHEEDKVTPIRGLR